MNEFGLKLISMSDEKLITTHSQLIILKTALTDKWRTVHLDADLELVNQHTKLMADYNLALTLVLDEIEARTAQLLKDDK